MCTIGKTSSTRNQTNTSEEFSLWLEDNEKVNPTDIVVTQNPRRVPDIWTSNPH